MNPVTAIGMASSVATVASDAVQLVQILNLYYNKLNRTEADIRALALEIEQLAAVLEKLFRLVDEQDRIPAGLQKLYSTVGLGLDRCEEIFAEIWNALLRVIKVLLGTDDKIQAVEFLNVNCVLWSIKQQRLEVLRSQLRQIQTELHLVVTVDYYEIHLQEHQEHAELERERLRFKDEEVIILDLEAQIATLRHEALIHEQQRRHARKSSTVTKIDQSRTQEPKQPKTTSTQHQSAQTELTALGPLSVNGIAYNQHIIDAILGTSEGKLKISSASPQTNDTTQVVNSPPTESIDGGITGAISDPIQNVDGNSEPVVRTDQHLVDGAMSAAGISSIAQPYEAVAKTSGNKEPSSATVTNPLVRATLPTTPNATKLQDTANNLPCGQDEAISEKETTVLQNPRSILRVRFAVGTKRHEEQILPSNSGTSHDSTLHRQKLASQSTYYGDPDIPEKQTPEITTWLKIKENPQRYRENAREMWIIQGNNSDKVGDDYWHSVTATRTPLKSRIMMHRLWSRLVHADKNIEQQLALSNWQKKYIGLIWEEMQVETGIDEEEGFWKLEDMELVPKGEVRHALRAIKMIFRWQPSSDNTDMDEDSEDGENPWPGETNRPWTNPNMAPMSIKQSTYTVEYPGHPNRPAKILNGKDAGNHPPVPEDFGIPSVLHRPGLWDRLRGRTGVCKECTRLYKKVHDGRLFGQSIVCIRCSTQYEDKVEAYKVAYASWYRGLPGSSPQSQCMPPEQATGHRQGKTVRSHILAAKPVVAAELGPAAASQDSELHPKREPYSRYGEAPGPSLVIVPYRPSERAFQIMRGVMERGSNASRNTETERQRPIGAHNNRGYNDDSDKDSSDSDSSTSTHSE